MWYNDVMRKISISRLNELIRSLLREKDNLTDVVAVVSQSKPSPSNNGAQSGSKPPQQVTANNGEIITLGNNPSRKS